jgi:hypothetical protein
MYHPGAMAAALSASDLVRGEWLRRVQAEYTSAAVSQHLGLWLLQIGASPDLIRLALRVVTDEIEHARLSHAVYVRARGAGAPRLEREHLELSRSAGEPLERDVARVALSVFCLGETVAVPLFRRMREGCRVKVARRALDRVLRDEVRHRDFGWLLLDWLLAQPFAGDVRALAAAELPGMFGRLSRMYGFAEGEQNPALPAEDRAWGLMSPAEYWIEARRTLERDWAGRFGDRGIDARAAWERGIDAPFRTGGASAAAPTG